MDNGKSVTHKIKFIDSFIFMSISLSKRVKYLSEKLHSGKCTNTDCKSNLDFMSIKDDLLIFRCFKYKNNYKKDFNKELIRRFENTHKFCNGDTNKFIFLLRKGVYSYEYIGSWERLDETSLPDKKAFYSNLNIKDITDVDYRQAKRVFKEFNIKNLGEYHDLHVQSDTLLLADIFENFRNKCIKIYELDPAHFLSAPRLAWKACLRKTGVKLELLIDIDMLLIVGKETRGGTVHALHKYAKANKKYMKRKKNYDKNIKSSYLENLDANNLYGWAMSQKFPVNGFKWIKHVSKFDEDFIKNYNENSNKGYSLEADVEYPKDLLNLHGDLPFLAERKKIKKCKKLVCNINDKKKTNYVVHIRGSKQALNHGLIFKKVHRVIQFNQKTWLKPYVDMNIKEY